MNFLEKVLGSFSEKEIKRIYKIVDKIEALEPEMQELSDEALKMKTEEFKGRLNKGETLDDLLVEAFAVVREGAVRSLGMRHYRVQLLGGIVLHEGSIAEMKTGEGKTLVATLAVYLNALSGKGVHVITVNDYLAKRDRDWMGKLYEFMGLSVGCVINDVRGAERIAAYRCDVTYGTNNEFGFDYLRDNMIVYKKDMTLRGLNYAIIDEVDSILVDEARTPLIISGEGAKSTDLYTIANRFVMTLKSGSDYSIDEKGHSVFLSDESGIEKAERFFKLENFSDPQNMEVQHHINNALKANNLMKRDVDYVVKDGEVLIVDEFTGRLMFGRRYSNGLHQAIEAKEGLEVRKESQTLATITLQNYFRNYQKLSGMTGTAKTEEEEFRHIYGMDVIVIPTNRPIQRQDMPDSVYKSLKGKFNAVINQIEERHAKGQPILVGTISIENSELLSSMLRKRGIRHEVLNAKQHDKESEIVSQAGRFGSVTIATNMAGRGTDIVLGGNAEFMSLKEMRKRGYEDNILNYVTSPIEYNDEAITEAKAVFEEILNEKKLTTDAEGERVKSVGGLHIIGTERHESRRIDNQLRGRAGRQGDPGSSQFFISFEDDLMRLFMSDRIKGMVEKLGMDDDMQIEAKILTKSIEGAQKKVESRNFGIRKHVLQYDDVMNKQREIIYTERQSVLKGENLRGHIWEMLKALIEDSIALYTAESSYAEEWDLDKLQEHLHPVFLPKGSVDFSNTEDLTREKIAEDLLAVAEEYYTAKENEIGEERMRELERVVLLRVVDSKWIDHIDAMDQLKQGVGLRAVGNEDPVRAYQIEGFDMFNEMTKFIQEDTLKYLFHVTLETDTKRETVGKITGTGRESARKIKKPQKRQEPKVGRNELCPCGSGKKYKKCCGVDA